MLKIAVCVSGGGTNLQAIIDGIENQTITNTEIEVVISNNKNAYALERAKQHGIKSICISPKDYASREEFNEDFLKQLNSYHVDLVVLAGFLVVIPEQMIKEYTNRIINIHPSLIPSFCGTGYYGLKVHEGVLSRGVKVTGATVHFVDEGTDTGPIILQKAVAVEETDTPEVLQRRVMEQAEWIIMPKAIDLIANGKVTVTDGKVHIGYMPGDKIVGLSKPARLVDAFARRFQVQERMTREILDCFDSVIEPYGTIVMVEARHLCMQMRGVEKQNASTTTCLYSGNFKDRELREEFFSMLRNR